MEGNSFTNFLSCGGDRENEIAVESKSTSSNENYITAINKTSKFMMCFKEKNKDQNRSRNNS